MNTVIHAVAKPFFLVLLLGCFSADLFSQVKVGIRGGVNVSSFRITPDAVNIEDIGGLALAVPVEIRVSDYLVLQPEIGLAQKGLRYTRGQGIGADRGLLSAESAHIDLTYLELPFLIKFSPYTRRDIAFQAYLGPHVGVLLNGKQTRSFGSESENLPTTENLSARFAGGDIKAFDIGASLGVSAVYRLSGRNLAKNYRGEIVMDVRYTIGTTDLDPNWEAGKVTNRALSITWGYRMRLGK